jgi:hypothetical protein
MKKDKLDILEDYKMIQYRIREEGFHYCFKNYSSFSEIEDKKFHKLRLKYLESAKDLEKYIEKKIKKGSQLF